MNLMYLISYDYENFSFVHSSKGSTALLIWWAIMIEMKMLPDILATTRIRYLELFVSHFLNWLSTLLWHFAFRKALALWSSSLIQITGMCLHWRKFVKGNLAILQIVVSMFIIATYSPVSKLLLFPWEKPSGNILACALVHLECVSILHALYFLFSFFFLFFFFLSHNGPHLRQNVLSLRFPILSCFSVFHNSTHHLTLTMLVYLFGWDGRVGPHLTVLGTYPWLYIQGSLSVVLRESFVVQFWDQSRVGHVQPKHLTSCNISLAFCPPLPSTSDPKSLLLLLNHFY